MSTGTILIVEDNEGLAHLMDKSLSRVGFTVLTKQNAKDALDECDFGSIDLLIVDYQLGPSETGVQFYTEVCSRGFSVPAILVTGFGDESVLLEALRFGVRDFLPKNDNLLEILPLIAERVMRDVRREKQLVDAEKARMAQQEVQAALDAATIGYWSENSQTHEIIWPTKIVPDLKPIIDPSAYYSSGATDPYITSLVDETDRPTVATIIKASREGKVPFHVEFRGTSASRGVRWYRMKAQYEYDPAGTPVRLTGIIWDETEKREQEIRLGNSLAEVESLAQRLKVSMMETHHRVKNSFQIVRSLLNMELRKAGSLSEAAVKRVLAHLQGLALIHDILTDNVKSNETSAIVSSSELVNRLVETLQGADPDRKINLNMVDLPVTARIASTLAVITTELVMNALKYGTGDISIKAISIQSDRASLTIANLCIPEGQKPCPNEKDPVYEKGGLGSGLVKFLAKADFRSELRVQQTETSYEVELEFPVERSPKGRSRLTLDESEITLLN